MSSIPPFLTPIDAARTALAEREAEYVAAHELFMQLSDELRATEAALSESGTDVAEIERLTRRLDALKIALPRANHDRDERATARTNAQNRIRSEQEAIERARKAVAAIQADIDATVPAESARLEAELAEARRIVMLREAAFASLDNLKQTKLHHLATATRVYEELAGGPCRADEVAV